MLKFGGFCVHRLLGNYIFEMDLASEEHQCIRLAFSRNGIVFAAEYIMKRNFWNYTLSANSIWIERNVYVLSHDEYIAYQKRGANLDDNAIWVPITLCSHDISFAKNCLYCQALVLCPDIELPEIEAAILDATGTLKEREQTVLQSFRGSAIKPAKKMLQ